MFTKGIVDEDFVNYKVPSMFINTSFCSFKCDKECGTQVCQNSDLVRSPSVDIDDSKIIRRFKKNPITKAIVIGGLEPFDSPVDLWHFIHELNAQYVEDDLVIYTGYNEREVASFVAYAYGLCCMDRDLVIKFGRYLPNTKQVFDKILGVNLASSNQYAKLYPKQINV